MAKGNEKKQSLETVDTIIGRDCFIKGEINVQKSMRVEGKIEGDIKVGGVLTIGSGGYIKGNVITSELVIGGEVYGIFEVNGKAELKRGCKFYGKIRCKGIIIEENAQFDGICTTTEKGKQLFDQIDIPFKGIGKKSPPQEVK